MVEEDVKTFFGSMKHRGSVLEHDWLKVFQSYSKSYHVESEEFTRRMNHALPSDWEKNLHNLLSVYSSEVRYASSLMILLF
jgi:transketolase